MRNIILRGDGWVVKNTIEGFGVFADDDYGSHLVAVRACVKQAHMGNELALTAVMMCENDVVLHRYMKDPIA